MMSRDRRRLLAMIGAVLGMLALGSASRARASTSAAGCRSVFVSRHEWHAGIIVDRRGFESVLSLDTPDFIAKDWLEFGWGDADFYRAEDPGLMVGLKALFLPTDSVMHVHGFDGAPPLQFPNSEVLALQLTADGHARLLEFLRSSFERDAAGRVKRLGSGLYGLSYFYEGEGKYHMFRTCNTWAAEALEAGGFPVDPSGVGTVEQLMDGLRGKAVEVCAA